MYDLKKEVRMSAIATMLMLLLLLGTTLTMFYRLLLRLRLMKTAEVIQLAMKSPRVLVNLLRPLMRATVMMDRRKQLAMEDKTQHPTRLATP
jgi:hypothetical protein